MTSFNKRVYEMLARVVVFGATHPQLFVGGTLAGELLGRIEAGVQKLSGYSASQVSGKGALKRSAADRAQARQALRDQLEAISRIARALQLPQFWMPRDRRDSTTVDVGKAFAAHAEPLKQLFVDNQLPEDFIDRLNVAVQNLEVAIKDQTASRANRKAATGAIDQTRSDALGALQHLDPIMENLLRNDPPTLAVWQTVRRVERYATASKPVQGEHAAAQSAPVPPVNTNAEGAHA